jgi:hypothetical protein
MSSRKWKLKFFVGQYETGVQKGTSFEFSPVLAFRKFKTSHLRFKFTSNSFVNVWINLLNTGRNGSVHCHK